MKYVVWAGLLGACLLSTAASAQQMNADDLK
jgi:hypothetical protein